MKKVAMAEAMKNLRALAKEAAEGERIRITVNGRVVAALVPFEDADHMQAKEDALDVAEAERILAEDGAPIPYDQVRKELGLDRAVGGATVGRQGRSSGRQRRRAKAR